jgi:hypothetical protein
VIQCISDTPFSFIGEHCHCQSLLAGGEGRTTEAEVSAEAVGVQELAAKQGDSFGEKQWDDAAFERRAVIEHRFENSWTWNDDQGSNADPIRNPNETAEGKSAAFRFKPRFLQSWHPSGSAVQATFRGAVDWWTSTKLQVLVASSEDSHQASSSSTSQEQTRVRLREGSRAKVC